MTDDWWIYSLLCLAGVALFVLGIWADRVAANKMKDKNNGQQ